MRKEEMHSDKRQVGWGWGTGLYDMGAEDIAGIEVEVGCLLGWGRQGCCDLTPTAA